MEIQQQQQEIDPSKGSSFSGKSYREESDFSGESYSHERFKEEHEEKIKIEAKLFELNEEGNDENNFSSERKTSEESNSSGESNLSEGSSFSGKSYWQKATSLVKGTLAKICMCSPLATHLPVQI